jgi:hypothetical protein
MRVLFLKKYERLVIYFLLLANLLFSLFLYRELSNPERIYREVMTERLIILNGDGELVEIGAADHNSGLIRIKDSRGRTIVSIGANYRAPDYVSAELMLFNYRKDKTIGGYYGARGYSSREE